MKNLRIEHVERSLILFLVFVLIACSHHPTPSATRTAILSWQAPTTDVDGSPITDPQGYKVYVGEASGSYQRAVDVGNRTSFILRDLKDGDTYFFAVTAYNSAGFESKFSNEVSMSFTATPRIRK